jgi:acylphosphatase
MRRIVCHFYGRVQGVLFRRFTATLAVKYGIGGWVQNRADGTVELVADGEEEDLKSFFSELQEGPPAADVRNFDVRWEEIAGGEEEFRIKY